MDKALYNIRRWMSTCGSNYTEDAIYDALKILVEKVGKLEDEIERLKDENYELEQRLGTAEHKLDL